VTLQEAIARKRTDQAKRLIEEERLGDAAVELLLARRREAAAREQLREAGQCRWKREFFATELEEAEEHLLDRAAIAREWGVL
jgi:hypothetical protein